MDNKKLEFDKYLLGDSNSVKDYILLIKNNLPPFVTISAVIFIIILLYAIFRKDVYESTVDLRIKKSQQEVLQSDQVPETNDNVMDRFISDELNVFTNYNSMLLYSKALIDSFDVAKNKALYPLISSNEVGSVDGHKNLIQLVNMLEKKLKAQQITGSSIIEISIKSPSPYEAALIVNTCADKYKEINLEDNRDQLKTVRIFLGEQREAKFAELNNAEDSLKIFQEKGGIVSLDAQSQMLINQLSQLDAKRDAAKIDLSTSNEVLNQYRNELNKVNPRLADYLESQTSQAYIDVLQKQIADLQVNRDLALANSNSNVVITEKVKEYNKKIADLKQKLSSLLSDIKSGALASTPDQVRDLSQKLLEEEINNHSLSIQLKSYDSLIHEYEQKLNKLPKTSIELARYQRRAESLQQLYLLVEQKYQEALINELSQPGNVSIIGKGVIPDQPANLNQFLVIFVGLFLGPVIGFGYVLVRDYFDNSVKSPNDIQNENINFLAWVPFYKTAGKNGLNGNELIVREKPGAPTSEAFRSIKMRVQFSGLDSDSIKTILVTSPAEKEGKTFVATNLAESYAQAGKKTLLIDCDLRRPRIHKILNVHQTPGLVEYLFKKAPLEEIIRNKTTNFYYITAGTTPPNPAEVLGSKAMRGFLERLRSDFDIIILDSAPVVAVVDSEVLANIADGTILVISADKTEIPLMKHAVDLLKEDKAAFLGTVLNNFKRKSGYGYYYKYYYNYSSSSNGNGKKSGKVKV